MLTTEKPLLAEELRRIVGDDGVLAAHADLVVYECDGFVIEKNCPDVVVFPRTTEQVAGIVQAVQSSTTCRSCRAARARAWPAAACRSAAA